MRTILNPRALVCLAIALGILLAFPLPAGAQNYTVVCGDLSAPADFHSLNDALGSLDMAGPHTLTVSGICTERVAIGDGTFAPSNLAIMAAPGQTATITPGPNGQGKGWVVLIAGAHDIWLDHLIIRGGNIGIQVADASEVDTSNLTIENNGGAGVWVDWNSTFFFSGQTVIRNNGRYGVVANRSLVGFFGGLQADGTLATPLIEGNSWAGVSATAGSTLTFTGPGVIRNNGTAGIAGSGGINVSLGSVLSVNPSSNLGLEISGNSGPGIFGELGASLSMSSTTISNNAGPGVQIRRLSVAELAGQNTFSHNVGGAVVCDKSSFLAGSTAGIKHKDIDCQGKEEEGKDK
jgi:hypothetical protein